jgi:hypothetical protein
VVPRSPRTDRRGRCPAISRPPRHEYAAAFPRGLLTGLNIPAPESPAPCSQRTRTTHRPRSTRFESARRLRDFTRWFLSYTFSSRLPDPRRLAVPTRPVVVRTAPHPPRRLPDQAVLSFNQAAATTQRQGPSTPTRSHWRLVAHEHIIETAARIGHCPSVQLGLHPKYPSPRLGGVDGPRDTGIHQCVSFPVQPCCDPAGPLPQVAGFPGLAVLRALRPIPARSTGHASTRTGAPLVAAVVRERRNGSHVHPRTLRRDRHPAMPLHHRHDYAAGHHRGLPDQRLHPAVSSPTAQGIIGCAVRSDPDPPGFGSVVQS